MVEHARGKTGEGAREEYEQKGDASKLRMSKNSGEQAHEGTMTETHVNWIPAYESGQAARSQDASSGWEAVAKIAKAPAKAGWSLGRSIRSPGRVVENARAGERQDRRRVRDEMPARSGCCNT